MVNMSLRLPWLILCGQFQKPCCCFLFLQTYLYNDLFFYNIRKNTWVKSEIPNPPPPRCSHQVHNIPDEDS